MIPDKYYVAYRHAHIMRSLGSLQSQGEDVTVLLDIAIRNCVSALRFHGCERTEAEILLTDAINYELNTMVAAETQSRAALHAALKLIGNQRHH